MRRRTEVKKECVAMLLAGGQGSRLYVLTGDMAKPAVPFGGKFRIIDFPLSNCTNSGIDTVGVLTQYRPLELNSYIGNGQPWELDRLDGGVHILPPYQSATGASWYKGTANAIYQNIGFVDMYDPEYVAVLSGDHIYKMDYADMLRRHKEAGAVCTISVMEVPWSEASRFGIMAVDGEDRITEFAEKPKEPKSNLASMGIYIFTWKKLREYLLADEQDPNSENDFGKNVIPAMLNAGEPMAAYRFEGYWKDVGTLDSLWDANMDMLLPGSGLNLLDKKWPIYGRTPSCPPAYVGEKADVGNSAVAKGCDIRGEVKNSVLSYNTVVEEGASVSYSVLMPGAVVKKGAKVQYAIVGERACIGAEAQVGASPETVADPAQWGVTVLGPDSRVAAGEVVAAKTMIDRTHGEG
ncbi:MAG: glucose-1-phosphate adenylyltransferase [Ruminococcaceae bacterium]|nr:glucose-1-phosphate adenylyltransferase [Oscillospiraceae bacterium]